MGIQGRGIQSIEIGNRLLRALVKRSKPTMLRDLAQEAGLTPAQAHAYLVSFRKLDLVEQDSATGDYRLGPFAVKLGMGHVRGFMPLRASSHAAEDLCARLGHTVAVVVLADGTPTAIEVFNGRKELNLNIHEGTAFSLTGTVSGRVFAAFARPEEVAPVIRDTYGSPKRNGLRFSIPDYERFTKLVEQTRADGYAAGINIGVKGISAIAVPVLDKNQHPYFVLLVIGEEDELPVGPDSGALRDILAVAEGCSRQLATKIVPAATASSGKHT